MTKRVLEKFKKEHAGKSAPLAEMIDEFYESIVNSAFCRIIQPADQTIQEDPTANSEAVTELKIFVRPLSHFLADDQHLVSVYHDHKHLRTGENYEQIITKLYAKKSRKISNASEFRLKTSLYKLLKNEWRRLASDTLLAKGRKKGAKPAKKKTNKLLEDYETLLQVFPNIDLNTFNTSQSDYVLNIDMGTAQKHFDDFLPPGKLPPGQTLPPVKLVIKNEVWSDSSDSEESNASDKSIFANNVQASSLLLGEGSPETPRRKLIPPESNTANQSLPLSHEPTRASKASDATEENVKGVDTQTSMNDPKPPVESVSLEAAKSEPKDLEESLVKPASPETIKPEPKDPNETYEMLFGNRSVDSTPFQMTPSFEINLRGTPAAQKQPVNIPLVPKKQTLENYGEIVSELITEGLTLALRSETTAALKVPSEKTLVAVLIKRNIDYNPDELSMAYELTMEMFRSAQCVVNQDMWKELQEEAKNNSTLLAQLASQTPPNIDEQAQELEVDGLNLAGFVEDMRQELPKFNTLELEEYDPVLIGGVEIKGVEEAALMSPQWQEEKPEQIIEIPAEKKAKLSQTLNQTYMRLSQEVDLLQLSRDLAEVVEINVKSNEPLVHKIVHLWNQVSLNIFASSAEYRPDPAAGEKLGITSPRPAYKAIDKEELKSKLSTTLDTGIPEILAQAVPVLSYLLIMKEQHNGDVSDFTLPGAQVFLDGLAGEKIELDQLLELIQVQGDPLALPLEIGQLQLLERYTQTILTSKPSEPVYSEFKAPKDLKAHRAALAARPRPESTRVESRQQSGAPKERPLELPTPIKTEHEPVVPLGDETVEKEYDSLLGEVGDTLRPSATPGGNNFVRGVSTPLVQDGVGDIHSRVNGSASALKKTGGSDPGLQRKNVTFSNEEVGFQSEDASDHEDSGYQSEDAGFQSVKQRRIIPHHRLRNVLLWTGTFGGYGGLAVSVPLFVLAFTATAYSLLGVGAALWLATMILRRFLPTVYQKNWMRTAITGGTLVIGAAALIASGVTFLLGLGTLLGYSLITGGGACVLWAASERFWFNKKFSAPVLIEEVHSEEGGELKQIKPPLSKTFEENHGVINQYDSEPGPDSKKADKKSKDKKKKSDKKNRA